jgi:hypothetical protein
MLVYQVFYFIYLTNYFQFEYGMLHTWDIIAERFGWMLVWGDYALVPFFYSIPGWYLIDQTDLERVLPGHLIDGVHPDAVLASLGPQDHQCTDHERDGYRDGLEQRGLDRFAEQQAEDGQRHESHSQVEHESLRGAIAEKSSDDTQKLRTIFPAHGQDGTALDDDLEDLALFVVEVQQVTDQDEVAGAGNREELCKALYDTEQESLAQQDPVHAEDVLGGGMKSGELALAAVRSQSRGSPYALL